MDIHLPFSTEKIFSSILSLEHKAQRPKGPINSGCPFFCLLIPTRSPGSEPFLSSSLSESSFHPPIQIHKPSFNSPGQHQHHSPWKALPECRSPSAQFITPFVVLPTPTLPGPCKTTCENRLSHTRECIEPSKMLCVLSPWHRDVGNWSQRHWVQNPTTYRHHDLGWNTYPLWTQSQLLLPSSHWPKVSLGSDWLILWSLGWQDGGFGPLHLCVGSS